MIARRWWSWLVDLLGPPNRNWPGPPLRDPDAERRAAAAWARAHEVAADRTDPARHVEDEIAALRRRLKELR